jgi:hypothetical protein
MIRKKTRVASRWPMSISFRVRTTMRYERGGASIVWTALRVTNILL